MLERGYGERPSWDQYFMDLLGPISRRSHDRHTTCACLVVGADHAIRTTGFNGLPRGIDESRAERYERPEKYYWMEHAERNAIYNAARIGVSLTGCTMYLDWFPCMDCARGVVQAGITRLVCAAARTQTRRDDPKWAGDFARAGLLLQEAGVQVDLL